MKVVFYISAGKIIYGSLEPLYCRQSGYTHTHTISRFIPFVYTRSFIIMDRISIFRTGRPIIKKRVHIKWRILSDKILRVNVALKTLK